MKKALAVSLSLALCPLAHGQEIDALDQLGNQSKSFMGSLMDMVHGAQPVIQNPHLFEVRQPPQKFDKSMTGSGFVMIVREDQLDKSYQCMSTMEKGPGEKGIYSGQMVDNFIWKFHRAGNKLQFMRVNTGYRADPGTPAERAVQRSFEDSVMASVDILSAGPDNKSFAIDPAGVFLTDLPGIGPEIQQAYGSSGGNDAGQLSEEDGNLANVIALPKDVEIRAKLVFKGSEHPPGGSKLPDPRKISIVLRYTLSELPASGYQPRLADDRVGYFTTTYQDWTKPTGKTPYVQLINRWRLEKKDPDAAVSEVKEPIVYWMENTIPLEFRGAVRDGIIAWNQAFEAIGFKNAIVAKQEPDDPAKAPGVFDPSAADTRYNMIRWFIGDGANYAIGPSRVNPLTGEIYNATVSISGWIARDLTEQHNLISARGKPASGDPEDQYDDYMKRQAVLGLASLKARGELSPETEKKFMDEYITSFAVHEVGHTLGLRHNFKSSTYKDAKDMGQGDIVGSVMDYNPVNIAPEGAKQGHYFQVTPGVYDHWAIEYGYKILPGLDTKNEKKELDKIASRSAEPGHAYGPDEDANGSDPYVKPWNLSKDPLADAQNNTRLADKLWKGLSHPSAGEAPPSGRDYEVFQTAMSQYVGAAETAASFVGGIMHTRSHPGDLGEVAAFRPVPAEKQREALEFLDRSVFSDRPFQFSPELISRLEPAAGRKGEMELDSPRVYPLAEQLKGMRGRALAQIYDADTLKRLEQSSTLNRAAIGVGEVFENVRKSVWGELKTGEPSSAFRRDLQMEHLSALESVVSGRDMPGDAVALARRELWLIVHQAQAALKSKKLGSEDRAHLRLVIHNAKSVLDSHGSGHAGSDED